MAMFLISIIRSLAWLIFRFCSSFSIPDWTPYITGDGIILPRAFPFKAEENLKPEEGRADCGMLGFLLLLGEVFLCQQTTWESTDKLGPEPSP